MRVLVSTRPGVLRLVKRPGVNESGPFQGPYRTRLEPRTATTVPTNRITEILNGRRAVSGDTALRLAHSFGTSAEFWLNLQKLYELRLAKKRAGRMIEALPTLKNEHVHA